MHTRHNIIYYNAGINFIINPAIYGGDGRLPPPLRALARHLLIMQLPKNV